LRLSERDSGALLARVLPVEVAHWGTRIPLVRERTNTRGLAIDGGAALRLTKVETVSYSGYVYNMHVEEDESYVVGGLAVHNCWMAREAARQVKPKAQTGRLDFLSR
jgi:hypothetical protein